MTKIYRGQLRELNTTTAAVIITEQGLDLLGRSDRRVYLPKSQIQIKGDDRRVYLPKSQIQIKGDVLHGYEIYIPEWLIIKNRINWNRIQEIEPIDPPRR